MTNQIVSNCNAKAFPYYTIAAVFLNSIPAKPTFYSELFRTASQFLMIIIKILVDYSYDFH